MFFLFFEHFIVFLDKHYAKYKCFSVDFHIQLQLNLNGMYKVQHTRNPVAIIQCDHTMYVHSNKNELTYQMHAVLNHL